MKIIRENIDRKKNNGVLDLVPECCDDIYELSKVIVPEDQIKSFTHRKLSLDGRTQQRIGCYLTIKIESYTVDLENGILYAKGKVCEENEYVKQGVYHTLEIELDKKFSLYKDKWTKSDLSVIKESTKSSQNIMFIIFYEKDAVICLVGKNRIKVINKIEIKNKKFTNFLNIISLYIDKVEMFVICSVSSIINDFNKFVTGNIETIKKNTKNTKLKVTDKFVSLKLPNELKNSTNKQIVNYVLTDKDISSKFNNLKYVSDLREMSNYFLQFDMGNHDHLVGKAQIKESVEYGALEKIFFTDEVYRPHCLDKRRRLEDFCKELENSRVKIFVIPVNHHLGEKLKEIGGVCGILKFIYK